jgi:hypothetical protein
MVNNNQIDLSKDMTRPREAKIEFSEYIGAAFPRRVAVDRSFEGGC